MTELVVPVVDKGVYLNVNGTDEEIEEADVDVSKTPVFVGVVVDVLLSNVVGFAVGTARSLRTLRMEFLSYSVELSSKVMKMK